MRDEPRIKPLHRTTADDPIYDTGGFPSAVASGLQTIFPTVVTRSAIHIFPPGRDPLHLPLEYQFPQCQMVQVGRTHDRRYISWYTQPSVKAPCPQDDALPAGCGMSPTVVPFIDAGQGL
jgi:hypothetical protein